MITYTDQKNKEIKNALTPSIQFNRFLFFRSWLQIDTGVHVLTKVKRKWFAGLEYAKLIACIVILIVKLRICIFRCSLCTIIENARYKAGAMSWIMRQQYNFYARGEGEVERERELEREVQKVMGMGHWESNKEFFPEGSLPELFRRCSARNSISFLFMFLSNDQLNKHQDDLLKLSAVQFLGCALFIDGYGSWAPLSRSF